MKKMLESISHMWKSLRRLFSSLTERATSGTGVAVRAIGVGAATIMSVGVMIILLVIIAVAAIPYGVFTSTSDQQKQDTATNQEAGEPVHCQTCGLVDNRSDGKFTVFVQSEHGIHCPTCYEIIRKENTNEETLDKS